VNIRHRDAMPGILALLLASTSCSSEGEALQVALRSPADPTLLDGVETFVFSVEDAEGRALVLRRFDVGTRQLRVDDVPHGARLTFRLEGLFHGTPIVQGRSCPIDVPADRPLPPVSLFVSRAGTFSSIDGPPGDARFRPMFFSRSDGAVVVAGGEGPNGEARADAALFDPRTGSWSAEPSLRSARRRGEAASFGRAEAIVVGGEDASGTAVEPIEVYRRGAGWQGAQGSVWAGGVGSRATSLPDGRVLLTGGAPSGRPARANAALFDGDGLFAIGEMAGARRGHAVAVVGSGAFAAVFVIGGDGGEGAVAIASIELFSPRSATAPQPFSLQNARLIEARADHTATALPTGEILVVGGRGDSGPLATAEIFDPITRQVIAGGRLARPRSRHTATLLRDGRVVVTGGVTSDGQALRSAELYDPVLRTFAAARSLAVERSDHVATELCDGTVLVVGGGAGAEIYNPAR